MTRPGLSDPIEPEKRAVRVGYWFVSPPCFLILMAFMWSPIALMGGIAIFDTPHGLTIEGTMSAIGVVVGWTWWSLSVPRWRLWAYHRVDDIELLKAMAVTDRLIWPDKSFWTKTELRTPNQRRLLAELEAADNLRRDAGTSAASS